MASKKGLWHRLLVAAGIRRESPGFLTKADIEAARAHPPPKQSYFARQRDQAFIDEKRRARAARAAAVAAEYEREFPYDEKPTAPVERVGRRGPTVSGGLPSLGKRR